MMTDIAIAEFRTENDIQVAAIETMNTIITFCRLSNMLCGGVVEDSMTCDDVLGAMVFDGIAVVEK
jgi:hypothetical protein